MKLDFKRIMSSVLAFVMLFSSLVMVNVVSVSAADGDRVFDLGSKTVRNEFILSSDGKVTANGNKSGKKEFYTFSEDDIKDFVVHLGSDRNSKADADTVSDDYDYDNQGYLLINGPNDYITFYAKNDNASLTIYVSKESSSDRQITVTGEGEGKATPKGDTPQTGLIPSNSSISKFEYTLDKADTYKIQNPRNGARIYSVIVNDKAAGEEPTPKATWNVETDSNLTDKVKLEPLTNSTSAVLRYTGDDNLYSVIPSRRIIKTQSNSGQYVTDNEDGSHTLNLKGTNWEYYLTQNINVPVGNIVITDGVNRALHLKCKTHNTVYTIKLQDGQAYAMIEEGENGGYTIPEQAEETIPLHNGELIASMAGGQLEKAGEAAADEVTFNIDSEASEIKATYKPFTVEKVNGTVEKTEFNKYKVSSVVRGERLFGGTVLDPEGKHFFVAAEKDVETDGVYTLTDPVALGTDIDMKAVVLRAPGSVAAGGGTVDDEQGIGFILADKTPEESETNVTYTLKVYCTSVNQNSSGAQKATETSIAIREIDPVTYTAIRSGYTKSDSITVQDDDHVLAPEKDYKEFANLQPGKAYAIFNPAGEDGEPQGNIRVYAMELTKIENTVTPSGDWYASNQNDILGPHYYKAATSKLEQNGEFYEAIFEEGKVKSINGQEYVSVEETAPIIPKISGTLKLYVMVDNTSDKSAEIKENGTKIKDVTLSKNRGVQGILPIEFKVEASKEYTIKRSGTGAVCLYKAVLTPDGPVVPTISGNVTLSKKFEYVAHTGVDDNAESPKYNQNVTFTNGESDGKTKIVNAEISNLQVKVKGPDGDVTDVDIKNNSSYTIGGSTEGGLKAGTYTITVTADGETKTETVEMPSEPAPQSKNISIEAKTYTVNFVTNIKNFEDNVSSSEKPVLKVFTGGDKAEELFALNDVTYYNTSDHQVNNGASTTHTVKMPAGSYKYEYSGKDYSLSLTSTDESAGSNLNFNVSRNSTKNIYFIPQYESTGAKGEVDTHKDEVATSYVTRGTYTFKTDTIPTNENTLTKVGIDYQSSANPDDHDGENHGMVAYFIKGLQNNKEDIPTNQYLGLSKDHGAIIFNVGTPILARIETGYKACVLYEINNKANAINSSHSAIPIDSSYGKRTVSLMPGTYAVISLADPAKNTEAKVSSITFFVDSPFKVSADNIKNVSDYTINGVDGNAKIVIGSYDAADDNLIGTTSAESYDKFAILIAKTEAALNVDAIDGIKEWTGGSYNAGEQDKTNVTVTDETQGYTKDNTAVYKMTVKGDSDAEGVIRDETTVIFGHIKDDNGTDIISDASGNTKYYATIVNNLTAGTYYAVGAAKVKGAAAAEDGKETWLVQDTPVSFTVNE